MLKLLPSRICNYRLDGHLRAKHKLLNVAAVVMMQQQGAGCPPASWLSRAEHLNFSRRGWWGWISPSRLNPSTQASRFALSAPPHRGETVPAVQRTLQRQASAARNLPLKSQLHSQIRHPMQTRTWVPIGIWLTYFLHCSRNDTNPYTVYVKEALKFDLTSWRQLYFYKAPVGRTRLSSDRGSSKRKKCCELLLRCFLGQLPKLAAGRFGSWMAGPCLRGSGGFCLHKCPQTSLPAGLQTSKKIFN